MKFENIPSGAKEDLSSREQFVKAAQDLKFAESADANQREFVADVMDANKGDGSRWDVVIPEEVLSANDIAYKNMLFAKSDKEALLRTANEEALKENEQRDNKDQIESDDKPLPSAYEAALNRISENEPKNAENKASLIMETEPDISPAIEIRKTADKERIDEIMSSINGGVETEESASENKPLPSAYEAALNRINSKVSEGVKVETEEVPIEWGSWLKEPERSEFDRTSIRFKEIIKRQTELSPDGMVVNTEDIEEYSKLMSEREVVNKKYHGLLNGERIGGDTEKLGESSEGSGRKEQPKSAEQIIKDKIYAQQSLERFLEQYKKQSHEKFNERHEQSQRQFKAIDEYRKSINSRPFWGGKKFPLEQLLLDPKDYGIFGFMAKFLNWINIKLAPKEEIRAMVERGKTAESRNKKEPYSREVFTKVENERDRLLSKAQEEALSENKQREESVAGTRQEQPKKYEIPLDEGMQVKYQKEHFGMFDVANPDQFKKLWAKGYAEHFNQFAEASIKTLVNRKKEGGIYADTVASVLNSGTSHRILMRLIALKSGNELSYEELLQMPFSKVAREYLGLDVEKIDKDYFKHFRKRE
ncbi:MAG: hypothetical protein AAB628_01505 [Patescibacteria group bacterium]